MPSRKKRNRARRYVEKIMKQVWEAVEKDNLTLAEKLSKRACVSGRVNPRIWNDRGRILQLCSLDVEAEEAFRYALALAPTYLSPMKALALMYTKLGSVEQAHKLLHRILELDPQDSQARERLRTVQALTAVAEKPPASSSASTSFLDLGSRWGQAAALAVRENFNCLTKRQGSGFAGRWPPRLGMG